LFDVDVDQNKAVGFLFMSRYLTDFISPNDIQIEPI